MRSVPPDPNALDAEWGFAEERSPESTRLVDSKELFARVGYGPEEPVAQKGASPPGAGGPDEADSEGKITLPPPVPVNEYVAKMMVRRPHQSDEITAVQRPRLDADPEREPPNVPSRKTIPWEPPPTSGEVAGRRPPPRELPQLGLECDEPGVPSRPSPRVGFGTLPAPRRSRSTDVDDDLLREPGPPSSRGFGDLEALDSPQIGSLGARGFGAPRSAEQRARARPGDAAEEIDFRLDLGLGFEEPPMPDSDLGRSLGYGEEHPPMTPPPGTLRYGLLEDEEESELRGGPAAYRPGPRGPGFRAGPDSYDPELDQTTAPGVDMAAHLRAMAPDHDADDPCEQMQQRFDAGDYSGALVLAEGLLEENPKHEVAREYAASCTELLRQMYQARIGDGTRVLRLAVAPDELRSLNLDHRAGFLLSCIDGYSAIDEILDVSGMPLLEALRILYELVQEGIVRGD